MTDIINMTKKKVCLKKCIKWMNMELYNKSKKKKNIENINTINHINNINNIDDGDNNNKMTTANNITLAGAQPDDITMLPNNKIYNTDQLNRSSVFKNMTFINHNNKNTYNDNNMFV
ncbi:hypothetical protein PFDG_05325, partial [Plasmodium falciparum Dd2]